MQRICVELCRCKKEDAKYFENRSKAYSKYFDKVLADAIHEALPQDECEYFGVSDTVIPSSEHLTESQTSNTSETINCNFYCHDSIPPSLLKKYYLLNINQLPTLYSILSKIASLFFVSAILTIFSHKFH